MKTNIRINNICEKKMDRFLMLDKNERIPLDVTLHLIKCKNCRTQVRHLTMAERIAASPLQIELPISNEKIVKAVEKTNPKWFPELKPVSMTNWVISGIIMILFMLFFGIFSRNQDERLIIAFYLVFAGVVSTYCAIFVGINFDFFVKKIKKFQNIVG